MIPIRATEDSKTHTISRPSIASNTTASASPLTSHTASVCTHPAPTICPQFNMIDMVDHDHDYDQKNSSRTEEGTELKILNWNANSLAANNRSYELIDLAENDKFDIISICETRDYQPDLPGYKSYKSQPDYNALKRGIAVYVKEDIVSKRNNNNNIAETAESCAVEIEMKDRSSLILWSIYINPRLSSNIIDKIFDQAIQYEKLMIFGDFNSRTDIAGDSSSNSKGNKLKKILNDKKYEFTIINDGNSTFQRRNLDRIHSSVVDLCVVSNDLIPSIQACSVTKILDSDHSPMTTVLKLPVKRSRPRNTSNELILSTKRLKRYFQVTSLPLCFYSNKPLVFMNYVATGISQAKIQTRQKKRRTPWWNDNIRRLVRKRNKALSIPKENPSRRSKVAKARKELKAAIDSAKSEQWKKNSESITDIFRFMKFKRRSQNNPNCSIQESERKANEIDKIFAQVSRDWFDCLNRDQVQRLVNLCEWRVRFRNKQPTQRMRNPFITGEWLKKLLLNQKKSTAAGYDNITQTVLKCFTPDLWNQLAIIMNQSLERLEFPNCWKHTILIALCKPSGGYRPISLISKIGKGYEKILLMELQKHITLPTWQFCQKKSSAQLAVTELHHKLVTDWWRKRKNVLIFFDIKKAFDSVSHPALLKHLIDQGVPDSLVFIIDDWLTHRTVQTSFNNCLSKKRTKNLGIPQGSPISLFLFNSFINDIPVPEHSEIFVYADDIALKVDCTNAEDYQKRIEQAVDTIIRWSEKKLLHMNMSKLEILSINPMPDISIEIEHQGKQYEITSSKTVKYLGMTMQPSLLFDEHIKKIIPDLNRRTSILRSICWNSPPRLYKQAYLACIRPKAMYCGNLVSYSKKFDKLEKIQNRNLRYILRAFVSSPIRTLQAAVGVPSLELYSNYQKANFYLHMNKSPRRCIESNLPHVYSPLDQTMKIIKQNFTEEIPTKARIKKMLMEDMNIEYEEYTGHFRFVYNTYPDFRMYRSPAITSAQFRAATAHMNIGSHLKRLGMKAKSYECRFCQTKLETLWRLLKHCNFRSRFGFLDLVRGSAGTQVDRLKMFKIMAKLGL